MVLIGNDNKKRLSWPIAKITELIHGRDGEIRTIRLKTQHGTVIRPVQRIFPLEVQAIANSDKELKEESIYVKCAKPEKVLNTNDVRDFYLGEDSVTEIEIKLKKIEQLQINLDKIAEDYCEIETSESLESIQLDSEDKECFFRGIEL
ncbi:DUF5641 domain-containing protein [Trichonephila clavipes]|nr:DUF5641 domain-containing protein [Trichonephila clavipes]